jgi:O-6-methylguanine DNA methyltransferase
VASYVCYAAPGWGLGEIVLEDGTVVFSLLPRPTAGASPTQEHPLAERLVRWFAGEPDPLDDVPLAPSDETPFFEALARALRTVPRGEVVTYGELAALAGRPGAARAAGTFCARCGLAPFLPVHRVVAANGLGGFGSLGASYKRRMLELEGWTS